MDGGDAWRVAACANTNVNRIMLRFRPIAPKPVTGTSASAAAGGYGEASQGSDVSVLGKRSKRKYVRIRRNSGYVRKNNGKSNGNANGNDSKASDVAVVTLQLMPEKDEPEGDGTLAGDSWCKDVDLDLTVEKIQIVENRLPPPPRATADEGDSSDLVAADKEAESWVTVESVTGTCMGEGDGEVLRCTDAEKVKCLEADTCPGFVCDGNLRVRWVNDAYKIMMLGKENNHNNNNNNNINNTNIVVWLKVKDSASAAWRCYSNRAFTCGVRLQYTWHNEKCTKMVPCDVWRLDCGGFAWRLDVKAALSLGL